MLPRRTRRLRHRVGIPAAQLRARRGAADRHRVRARDSDRLAAVLRTRCGHGYATPSAGGAKLWLADRANGYEVVQTMRLAPITKEAILRPAGARLAPIAPLRRPIQAPRAGCPVGRIPA